MARTVPAQARVADALVAAVFTRVACWPSALLACCRQPTGAVTVSLILLVGAHRQHAAVLCCSCRPLVLLPWIQKLLPPAPPPQLWPASLRHAPRLLCSSMHFEASPSPLSLPLCSPAPPAAAFVCSHLGQLVGGSTSDLGHTQACQLCLQLIEL